MLPKPLALLGFGHGSSGLESPGKEFVISRSAVRLRFWAPSFTFVKDVTEVANASPESVAK